MEWFALYCPLYKHEEKVKKIWLYRYSIMKKKKQRLFWTNLEEYTWSEKSLADKNTDIITVISIT